ncbi:MAG: hypothetical protein NTW97_04955, partial [Candidatus Krumholzibacteria bacterium]|nr:hypothetical protein [Candidatus Krumholzibacteria bacterium]
MKSWGKSLFSAFLALCCAFVGAHAAWIENGVPLTNQWGSVGGAVIASDGSSGAIIAYPVCRAGVSHIIAQHVNSLGVVLWGDEGIDVCTATGGQGSPTITSDGAGGALVAWMEYRNESWDIYAQRVNASGTVQWSANGVALCTATGGQDSPMITSDG